VFFPQPPLATCRRIAFQKQKEEGRREVRGAFDFRAVSQEN
jgi:hypothetical protein